jgi:hypothetical protein
LIETTEASRSRGDVELTGIRLVINPDTDEEFRRRVELLADHASVPSDLQAALRAHYPSARVVTGVTDIHQRWYVYRDGRWVNSGR